MSQEGSHPWILPLDAADATLARVGGKGANLIRLVRAGFAVPPGFVVTTEAYEAFVTENVLRDGILATAGSIATDDPEALEAASREIRDRFAAAEISSDAAAELGRAYARLATPAVAVRSSATAEDLPDMSFAGLQDTLLNVIGTPSLLDAVVQCWSSLWTARAMAYRARNGVPDDGVALAVVVQAMVPADAAGVLFTANPLNGRRKEVSIDAGLGLGESLVSGQVEPDHYVAATDGTILSKTLGSKALSIRGRPGGGTRVVEEDAGLRQALPDPVISELARLGTRVTGLYGAPQDIEWAWTGGEIALLQSRPITSLFPLPDGLPSEPLRVMVSFGSVQGMLDPITPLGQDVLRTMAAGAGDVFGYRYTPDTQPVLRAAADRFFVDLTPIACHPRGRRVLRSVLPLVDPGAAQALEPLWDDLRLSRRIPPGEGGAPWRVIPTLVLVLARVTFALLWPDHSRRRLQRHVEALLEDVRGRAQGAQTLAQRVALLEDVLGSLLPSLAPRFLPRLAVGMGSFAALRSVASRLDGESGLEKGVEALELTRGLPHNVTTEMDLELWRAACAIRGDSAVAASFAAAEAPALAASYRTGELPGVAQRALADFVERYGMRGVGEIDFGRARWRDDPTVIVQALHSYLQIDDPARAPDAVFARGEASAEAALDDLANAVRARRGGWLTSPAIRWAGRRMRALAGLRESPKLTIIRAFGVLREAILATGHALESAGVLAQADDIVYLRIDELRDLASGRAPDCRNRIADRRRRRDRELLRRQIPRVLLSDGQAFFEGLGAAPASGDRLDGSPVSPGVVEGVVRIVLDPHGARLVPGEILVCPATDPGWTPLFLAAGGLVMEVGGLMTHGAVVAREYGIPAVVGVHDATHRLVSGQRVRLDGATGRILILSETP